MIIKTPTNDIIVIHLILFVPYYYYYYSAYFRRLVCKVYVTSFFTLSLTSPGKKMVIYQYHQHSRTFILFHSKLVIIH
ncbi:unnamed protein product [Rotaria magnacalcarata]